MQIDLSDKELKRLVEWSTIVDTEYSLDQDELDLQEKLRNLLPIGD